MLPLNKNLLVLSLFLLTASNVPAQNQPCRANEFYDASMAMCMPVNSKENQVTRFSLQGNAFFTEITETGNRGRTAFSVPDFFMADLGSGLGESHYLNLDYMGTLERWTTPDAGYPELLQIGEENNQGVSYLDAQHPHSSPIMGVTLSDTWRFGDNDAKFFFAPRGESTDGPVAFMHRPTGMINPDAPLGHHVGQDVGHISSTVLGASVKVEQTQIEASTFNGTEPQPQNVDLPLGNFNSYAFRIIQNFSSTLRVMASYAYVSNPEIDEPDVAFVNRYSASIYNNFSVCDAWSFLNAFIWGAISNYDHAANLNSFTEEFLFKGEASRIWGRFEALQRTPAELQIFNTGNDPNLGQWVFALTLGYTQKITRWDAGELGLGVSVTNDLLPGDFQNSYSGNPWSGKIFLQLSGLKNWDF
jgi:hypothetical protein